MRTKTVTLNQHIPMRQIHVAIACHVTFKTVSHIHKCCNETGTMELKANWKMRS